MADVTRGDHERFVDVKQPVYIHDNVYGEGASPFDAEQNAVVLSGSKTPTPPSSMRATRSTSRFSCRRRSTTSASPSTTGTDLEPVRIVDAEFEEPDGTPALPIVDLTGIVKTLQGVYPAGPLATLASGASRIRVW